MGQCFSCCFKGSSDTTPTSQVIGGTLENNATSDAPKPMPPPPPPPPLPPPIKKAPPPPHLDLPKVQKQDLLSCHLLSQVVLRDHLLASRPANHPKPKLMLQEPNFDLSIGTKFLLILITQWHGMTSNLVLFSKYH